MQASPSPIPPLVLEALSLNRDGTAFALQLQRFCERLLTPSVQEQAKRFEDAASQRNSADTLRNRAGTMPPGERRDELLARAERFERRAAVLAKGEVMPRDLRYPRDSLRLVSDAREALLAAAVALDQLDPHEVSRFLAQLLPTGSAEGIPIGEVPIAVDAPAMLCRNAIGSALEMLGAYVDHDGVTRLRPCALAVATTESGGPVTQAQPPQSVANENAAT